MLIKAVPATLKWRVYKLSLEKIMSEMKFLIHAQFSTVKYYLSMLGAAVNVSSVIIMNKFGGISTLFDPLCRKADVQMPFLLNKLSKHNW